MTYCGKGKTTNYQVLMKKNSKISSEIQPIKRKLLHNFAKKKTHFNGRLTPKFSGFKNIEILRRKERNLHNAEQRANLCIL
jgi:hypothetical protein